MLEEASESQQVQLEELVLDEIVSRNFGPVLHSSKIQSEQSLKIMKEVFFRALILGQVIL